MLDAVRAKWGAPRETTIEANPVDVSDDRLAMWRAAGIDRISIGVQSLDAGELVTLGRDHRHGDGLAAIARAVDAGFRVSADFILGTPGTEGPTWIDRVLATGAQHLSVYELTIEERTAFGQRVRDGRLVPLDDDRLVDLYEQTHHALTARGFEHYEISSYAKPGARAIHNSRYWRGLPYLGLGVGAASLAPDGTRLTNPRRWRDYAAGVAPEISAPDDLATDRAWLGMRTSDGVADTEIPAPLADRWVAEGLATRAGGRICPTLQGFLMADRMAAQLVAAR